MGKRKAEEAAPISPSPSPEPTDKKRKQDDIPEDEKLEIDIAAPEPPSKKAKRAEKKTKSSSSQIKPKDSTTASNSAKHPANGDVEDNASPTPKPPTTTTPARSEYGIWIGNLPFHATKDSLRQFLKEAGGVQNSDIVRLNMPAPTDKAAKAQNKGFAYVDFASLEILEKAMGLSEWIMGGRRVLIKNAKSFEGRPEKSKSGGPEEGGVGRKEPAKRVFVGNLGFDVTREDLAEHFGVAGEVEDTHMATFEDSGKCKGFAWVRFKEVEAAEAAVRGFVYVKAEEDGQGSEDSDEDGEDIATPAKKPKKSKVRRHKKHINQLHGRPLRCEFAEDPQTRYKKRYGKGANTNSKAAVRDRRAPVSDPTDSAPPATNNDTADTAQATTSASAADTDENLNDLLQQAAAARSHKGLKPAAQKLDKEQRREERRKRHERHDARTVAPGKALAGAQRASGAIVAGVGKKVTFD